MTSTTNYSHTYTDHQSFSFMSHQSDSFTAKRICKSMYINLEIKPVWKHTCCGIHKSPEYSQRSHVPYSQFQMGSLHRSSFPREKSVHKCTREVSSFLVHNSCNSDNISGKVQYIIMQPWMIVAIKSHDCLGSLRKPLKLLFGRRNTLTSKHSCRSRT